MYILKIGTRMDAEERGFFGKEYFGNRDADGRGRTRIIGKEYFGNWDADGRGRTRISC